MQLAHAHNNSVTQLNLTGIANYDVYISEFNRTFGNSVTLDTITQFFYRAKGKHKPATLRIVKSALKKAVKLTFLTDCMDLRFLTTLDAAFAALKTGKPDRKVRRENIFSEEEERRLFANLPARIGLIIRTLFQTGLRISELTSIKLRECTIENGFAYIPIVGKGQKCRRVFIPENEFNTLKRVFMGEVYLFETRGGRRYSRIYLWRAISQASQRILGRRLGCHSCRHSFATLQHVEYGKSARAVADYLGQTVETFMGHYIHQELLPADLFKTVAA